MKSHRFMPVPALAASALCLLSFSSTAEGHGSVTPDEDQCLIRIGYYSAHFKIYMPQERGHVQYCEDLPAIGESVFVMEYGHSGLSEVPIDFRIVRNVTGQGSFTRLRHIREIADLDAHTVFYMPAVAQPDVFTALHDFEERGEFVGIVTVTEPVTGKTYTAVFPFEVGFTGFGYWPLLAVAGLLLQLNYLWMSGWFAARSWRGLVPKKLMPAVAAMGMLAFHWGMSGAEAYAAELDNNAPSIRAPRLSEGGHYIVRAEAALEPLTINRMHSWTIELRTAQGDPVENASVTISGGMPAHDHGLPTQARVTRHLGQGRYLLEGLRFHMHGAWQLKLRIEHGDVSDEVHIEFVL